MYQTLVSVLILAAFGADPPSGAAAPEQGHSRAVAAQDDVAPSDPEFKYVAVRRLA